MTLKVNCTEREIAMSNLNCCAFPPSVEIWKLLHVTITVRLESLIMRTVVSESRKPGMKNGIIVSIASFDFEYINLDCMYIFVH